MLSKRLGNTFLVGVLLLACCLPADNAEMRLPEKGRIDTLMEALTLEEKLSLVSGDKDLNNPDRLSVGAVGAIPGVPRLGIPALKMTDGPAGIRSLDARATALPAPVALAASFDVDLARRYGEILGEEGLAMGQDVLLSPMLNIVRTPVSGRNFETFGEDPVLTARLGTAQIDGIQSQGLMANAKHFVLNNQEENRFEVVVDINARALRELYLPAFGSAAEIDVATFMCSYNRIGPALGDGDYACATEELLTDILRQDWGYDGVVMTDWYAAIPDDENGIPQPSAKPYLAGLNIEMPNNAMAELLGDRISAGDVDMDVLDRSVRRILALYDGFGKLDPETRTPPDLNTLINEHIPDALKIATAGAVLLKNDADTLPLSHETARRSLYSGPTFAALNYGGGGSSRVKTDRRTSPLQALKTEIGLRPEYFTGIDLDGTPIPPGALNIQTIEGLDITSDRIDFTGPNPLAPGTEAVFLGILTPSETGWHDLRLQVSNGVAKVDIKQDDVLIASLNSDGSITAANSVVPTREGLENTLARVQLSSGVSYSVTLTVEAGRVGSRSFEVANPDLPMQLRLAWQTPSERAEHIEHALSAANRPDVETVIVTVFDEGIEGVDRDGLSLPHNQDALVTALAETGKPVIVILNTGAAVLMPWADEVAAILQVWYPGQEGGQAVVNLLLGKDEPGGRLPISFPVHAEDWPGADSAQNYPGIDGLVKYDEGRKVGYRWHAAEKVPARFPFGHGLNYADISMQAGFIGADKVTVTLENVSTRNGVAVPQIYLGAPNPNPADIQPLMLAGFAKIQLSAGERQALDIDIDPLTLRFWSGMEEQWRPVTGRRPVYLGRSSAEMELIGYLDKAP